MSQSIPPKAQHCLDAEGMSCPEPMMLIHRAIRAMPVGEVLLIKATDPAAERDIKQFCHFLGHELLLQREEEQGHWHFWLRKGAGEGA